MDRLHVLVVIGLVLISGCATSGGGDLDTSGQTATRVPTNEPTATSEGTTDTRSVERPDAPKNPWKKEPVVVGIRYQNDSYPDLSSLVRDAVDYWETEGAHYATWEPAFEVEPDSIDPDIVVEFKANVSRCELDHPGRVAGCAAILRSDSTIERPEVIEVVPGSTRYYTRETLKHEFGHVLGLRHGDEPVEVMDRSFEPFSRYRSTTYRVYVEHPASYAGVDNSMENIRHALEYYQNGAGGWMQANVTFEFTTDEQASDIRIISSKKSPAGSQIDFRARTIYLNGLPTTRHGWHVGYWLGFLFGVDEVAELPPAFDEPETDDRTDWW